MATSGKPIAISMGEPAGIGPDLVLLAWNNRKALGLPPFYLRGDKALLEERADRLGLGMSIVETTPEETVGVFSKHLPVVQTGQTINDTPGIEQPQTGSSVIASIERCVEDVQNGLADGVVTLPINKAALYASGFSHPGHTEFLGSLAAKHWPQKSYTPVMMIAGPDLMVVPVTIHIPLSDVPSVLTENLIIETARIVAKDLKSRFGFSNPRIAFCGLNPHAGENGSIGTEDRDVITPAIEKLQNEGIDAKGPYPADTLFHPEARKTYDCVLGMYHDQVLVPAKTIGFDDSVNVTLGLPFVRTSPDHGTAYALAGKGTARIDSFVASIRMAQALAHPEQF